MDTYKLLEQVTARVHQDLTRLRSETMYQKEVINLLKERIKELELEHAKETLE